METSNLVLFGTRETNSLITQYGDRLPLHLDPAAASEYGLLYVFPVGERYVLINSGLPWWRTPRYSRPPALALCGRRGGARPHGSADFLLFRGSPENVVAEGRFDQSWRVPEAEARQLRATGATTVGSGSAPTASR